MKKILYTILLLVAAINVLAYNFSAVCSSGQTLYYNITSDTTVELTYESMVHFSGGSTYQHPQMRVEGYVIIPDEVTYNGSNIK